jgi:hypothetical protein
VFAANQCYFVGLRFGIALAVEVFVFVVDLLRDRMVRLLAFFVLPQKTSPIFQASFYRFPFL